MVLRLVAIGVIGFYLGGYLPRVLVTGQHGWVVWLLAAMLVFGGPRALRLVGRRALALGRRS
jgi:hypothetical protein